MKRNLIVMAVLPFLAASCAQKIGPAQPESLVKYVPMTFTVEGQGVRSSLDVDGQTVLWTSGDMISLFDDVAGRVPKAFTITAGKVSAEVADGSTKYYGLYPYDGSATIAGNVLTTNIPSKQKAVAGSFGEEVNVAVAYTTVGGQHLVFKNALALAKFTLGVSDVVAVTITANTDVKIAGQTAITYSAGAVSSVSCTGGHSVTLSNEDGSALTNGAEYYVALAPVTCTGGITMTLTKSDGSVLIHKGSSDLVLSSNSIKPLGTISAGDFTACSGLRDAYEAGTPIDIAGILYDKASKGASQLLADGADLYEAVSGKQGVFFLNGTYTNSLAINFLKEVIFISDNPSSPATFNVSTSAYSNVQGGGSVVMKNINLVVGSKYFLNNGGSVETAFDKIHFDGCKISIGASSLCYFSSKTMYGGNSIRFVGCTIIPSVNEQLFNLTGCSRMDLYREIVFKDNVCTAASSKTFQVLNYANATEQDGSSWDCTVELSNNIIYNLSSANGLVRQYQVSSLHVGGNVYISGANASKSYYLFSSSQDKSVIRNTGDIYYNTGSGTWVYSGNGYGQPAGVTNTLSSLAESPFNSFNTSTGAYTLKADYIGYGPRE